jgi:hypothetical protein
VLHLLRPPRLLAVPCRRAGVVRRPWCGPGLRLRPAFRQCGQRLLRAEVERAPQRDLCGGRAVTPTGSHLLPFIAHGEFVLKSTQNSAR